MSKPRYIRPSGMSLKDEIGLLYMLVTSIKGALAKLDDDGSVTATNYEALCYTAICNMVIKYNGNQVGQQIADENFVMIGPHSISDKARCEALYQIFNMLRTFYTKLDADGDIADTDYVSGQYTAKLLWRVRNRMGTQIGDADSFLFHPGGTANQKELVDLYYALLSSWEGTLEKLDADGLGDSDYEALWYTATILIKVTNSAGSTKGNN